MISNQSLLPFLFAPGIVTPHREGISLAITNMTKDFEWPSKTLTRHERDATVENLKQKKLSIKHLEIWKGNKNL